MYLKAGNKDYRLTDSYNKPYIKVNGSILPLTTNPHMGGGVIKCKDTNNNTYRVLEYRSTSSSDSYYTSSIDPGNMSDTTALTRSSTSGESYLTRSSTSGTSYLTEMSATNTYLTYIRIDDRDAYLSHKTTSIIYSNIETGTVILSSPSSAYNLSMNIKFRSTITVSSSIYTITGYNWSTSRTDRNLSRQGTNTINTQIRIAGYDVYNYYTGNPAACNFSACAFTLMNSSYASYIFYTMYSFSTVGGVKTTGTSYLTRSSTYTTEYLTRSSTSGYSGKSSKSIEISSWL